LKDESSFFKSFIYFHEQKYSNWNLVSAKKVRNQQDLRQERPKGFETELLIKKSAQLSSTVFEMKSLFFLQKSKTFNGFLY